MNRTLIATIITASLFLIFWEQSAKYSSRVDLFVSRPTEIFTLWFMEFRNPDYWMDLKSTASALFVGYGMAAAIGYFLGALGYWFRQRGVDLNQVYLALASIPVFSLAPLLILALGSGLSTRVAVVILSSVFLIASSVFQAMRFADEEFGSILRDLNAKPSKMWLKILLPAGVFYALPSLKGAVALSLVGVFVAEWISSQSGLGKYILSAMSLYDAARLMVGIFSFMAISSIMMIVISIAEARTTQWRNFR